MNRNTQLLWIAEAEARRFQETILIQRSPSEPQLSVVSANRGSARCNRWRRLIAQLSPAAACRHPAPADAVQPCQTNGTKPADEPVPGRTAVAELVETSFDGQRG